MVGTEKKMIQWENQFRKAKKDFRVEGELALSPDAPPIERIVYSDLRIRDLQTDMTADGLRIQGRIAPKVIYSCLNEGNEDGRITFAEANPEGVAFEHLLEIGAIPADGRWDVSCVIGRGSVERHLHQSIFLDAELSLVFNAWEKDRQEMIIDTKALAGGNLTVEKEAILTETYLGKYTGAVTTQSVLELPYAKSPLARILSVQARPSGIRWETQGNRVKLDGNLLVDLTYVAGEDDGSEGSVEMAEWGQENLLPWQIEIDGSKVSEDMLIMPRVTVSYTKAEARGSEGIRVEAGIEAEVAFYQKVQDEAIVDMGSHDMILDINRRNVNVTSVVESKIVPMAIERIIDLPAGLPEIGHIVAHHVGSGVINGDCAGGKMIVEGTLYLNLTYAAADDQRFPGLYALSMMEPGAAIVWGDSVDAPAVDEGMEAEVDGVITGSSIEMIDGKRLRLTADALVKIKASEVRPLSVITEWAEVPTILSGPRPSMVFYMTQPGDTLWKVARKYQTTMEAVAKENHLSPEDALPINKRLIIPTVSTGKVTVLR